MVSLLEMLWAACLDWHEGGKLKKKANTSR